MTISNTISSSETPDNVKLISSRELRNSTDYRVNEIRSKLINDKNLDPELEYDRLNMFVRNELGGVVTMPLLAIVIALAMLFWAPVNEVLTWLLILFAAKTLLLSLCQQFANGKKSEINVELWRRNLVAAELIHGIAWAGVAYVGYDSPDPAVHMFVFAAIIVILTIRVMFASSIMPIVYAGTIPLSMALFARFAFLGTPFYLTIGSLVCGVHVYFLFLSHGLNSTINTMLEFRAEKDYLIADLEEAKAISDSARARAEAASMAKSRFLATMSHELRTPLNAILGFSEVMERELLGKMENETYKEYCGNIQASGKHLLKIINEILDLTRIEAGRYELEEKDVMLSAVVRDCCKLLALKASGKKIRFVEDYAAGLEPIWADERSVHQICLNLLSNALKFTPTQGTIITFVGTNREGEQFIRITDTGPGIPEDEIPKVMQAFGQGSLAHENAEGGTGLGLPIVINLIELHGGRFEITSELRKGTSVAVFFPKERVLAAVPPLQPLGQERHRRKSPIVKRASGKTPVRRTSIAADYRNKTLVQAAQG